MGHGVDMSLMWTKNFFGPDKVPWGTPPFGEASSDSELPIFTLCFLSNRKAPIHLTRWDGKPMVSNLSISIVWLIKSKALEKSSRSILIYVPWVSVAWYHWCTISTKMSVVQVPEIEPNCLQSVCGLTTLSTHFNTIDSKTLHAIGVKDIGLISFSTDMGGCFLGNGTIVAVFHRLRSTPSRRELL